MHEKDKAIKTVYFSILSNTGLALIKWLTGYFGGSYAVIADAIESTSDIFSSLLVLLGLRYASKPADLKHPYGHGRVEPLITFLVVAFLVVSALVIIMQSIKNIMVPHQLPESYTLWVMGGVIVWKEISFRIVLRKAKDTGSSALVADAWHHRSDAITSVTAFIGITIALVLGKGYESADDWAALFAACFILYNSYSIFKMAWGEHMDEQRYPDLEVRIRTVAVSVPGVFDTEKCFIRKAGMKYHIDLHAIVDANISVKEGHQIVHRLKDYLHEQIPELDHILIHMEPHQ